MIYRILKSDKWTSSGIPTTKFKVQTADTFLGIQFTSWDTVAEYLTLIEAEEEKLNLELGLYERE